MASKVPLDRRQENTRDLRVLSKDLVIENSGFGTGGQKTPIFMPKCVSERFSEMGRMLRNTRNLPLVAL